MAKTADATPPAPTATGARVPVAFVVGGIFALLAIAGVAASGQGVWRYDETPQRTIDLRWLSENAEALGKLESEMGAWVLSISSETPVQPTDQYEEPPPPRAPLMGFDIVPLPRSRAATPRSSRGEERRLRRQSVSNGLWSVLGWTHQRPGRHQQRGGAFFM
jgi:hypothetical protein